MPLRYRKIFLIPNQLCVVCPMALGMQIYVPISDSHQLMVLMDLSLRLENMTMRVTDA